MNYSDLNRLIEKTSHFDKDERYMATNDIMKALQHDINIDDNTESRICNAVLKQLDDKANDVQSIAVKCLGVLVKTVAEGQLSSIATKLCDLVLTGPDALRDVYSIGLKTLMATVPSQMGDLLACTLTPRLLAGMQDADNEIKRECLDSLTDLLKRFGHLMRADHEIILSQTSPLLTDPKPAIQKRAVICISALSTTLNDPLLTSLVDNILERIVFISSSTKLSATEERNLRIFIQTLGRITRSVGHRLGRHVERVVPLLIRHLGDFDDEHFHTDAGNELRENCFPALESFIRRCPREVGSFITQILSTSLQFMKFDPNYCYDDDEGEEENGSDDEDEFEEEYDDAGSDDDDTSWKVRKAALRVVSAAIRERDELLEDEGIFFNLCDELLSRFKEREESVQLEVINCATQLLEETKAAVLKSKVSGRGDGFDSTPPPPLTRSQSSGEIVSVSLSHVSSFGNANVNEDALQGYLEKKMPFVLRTTEKLLLGKPGTRASSQKIKSAIIILLRRFLSVLQGAVSADNLSILMDTLLKCLHSERNQGLKLECLYLLMDIFELHSPVAVRGFIPAVLPQVFNSSRDDWYKVVAASLKLLGIIISTSKAIIEAPTADSMEIETVGDFDLSPYYEDIYKCIYPRLEALDVDHEIKEASISCAGSLLAILGDSFTPALELNIVHLLLKRLDNEVTRIAALKAIALVAKSPADLGQEISTVLSSGAINKIIPFLRQQSRLLRQTTLQTVSAIITVQDKFEKECNVSLLSSETICELLKELSHMLLVSDMNIADVGLHVVVQMIQGCRGQVESEASIHTILKENVLLRAVDLTISPIMQESTQKGLTSLLCLFFQIPQLHVTFNDIKDSLVSHVIRGQRLDEKNGVEYVPLPSQSISNLAKCFAGVCDGAPDYSRRETLTDLIDEVHSFISSDSTTPVSEARMHLDILCIGRMGANLNVATEADVGLAERLKTIINECFERGSEEIKAAAAFALGRLAVGSMSIFLPIVLEACTGGNHEENKHQYLLLVALKETIVVHVRSSSSSSLSFTPYLDTVLPGLFDLARASPEEGVRNMVAECLGALASTPVHTERITSLLQQVSHDEQGNKLLLWTVATSMRFFFSRVKLDNATYQVNPEPFLILVQDEDLDVRRAALLMINAAVHYVPSLILPYMEALVLPHILVLLFCKQRREVQMGPFKHIVDDALPLRKGALTCFETILYVMPDVMNPSDLLVELTKLVKDNVNETNLQCHQILCKLCSVAPSAMLCAVENFTDPLEKTISRYEKMESVEGTGGPEKDRALEQVRSCVRLISCVNKLDNLDVCPEWQSFMAKLPQKPTVAALLAEHEGLALHEKGL